MYKKLLTSVSALAFLLLYCCNSTNSSNFILLSESEKDSLTLVSLEKIDNSLFYTMTYYGDYGFASRVGKGGGNVQSSTQKYSASNGWGCTCFSALANNNSILGRNFDWESSIPLLLYTDPPIGYASVSMVDLEFLGYSRNNLPDDLGNRSALLNTPWWPFDGMNEKGVAIGMMAIPRADSPFDASKITIGEIEAIRLVLDFAASTDEAIQLLGEYNIRMETPPIHYLISDQSGSSAIVEFVDDKMIVIRNNEAWQVSTNFIIYGSGAQENSACWRYNSAYNMLRNADGNVSAAQAMNILQNVSSSTKWSVVYNLMTGDVVTVTEMNYNRQIKFNINDFSN